jgi:hypothetical protein
MAETKKLTDAEMSEIRNFQNTYSEITAKLGRLSVQKMLMEIDLNALESEINKQQEAYKTTNQSEQEFLQKISSTYGDGQVNLDTGEFTSK